MGWVGAPEFSAAVDRHMRRSGKEDDAAESPLMVTRDITKMVLDTHGDIIDTAGASALPTRIVTSDMDTGG